MGCIHRAGAAIGPGWSEQAGAGPAPRPCGTMGVPRLGEGGRFGSCRRPRHALGGRPSRLVLPTGAWCGLTSRPGHPGETDGTRRVRTIPSRRRPHG